MKIKIIIYFLRKTVIANAIIIFIMFITVINFIINLPVSAQTAGPCKTPTPSSPARAEGLVTAPTLSDKFRSSGRCIADSKTIFNPLKNRNFADLLSTYYDQSKLTKNTMAATLPGSFSGDKIYKSGHLTAGGSPAGSGTQVIFVDGELTINQDLIYHTDDGGGGLVFIVRGNTIIKSVVEQIDAVIISSGTIFTADSSCLISGIKTEPLVVNGSLIALSPANPIKFCRKLEDNSLPAEIINQQPKYLILLRHIMSDTKQRWSEVL